MRTRKGCRLVSEPAASRLAKAGKEQDCKNQKNKDRDEPRTGHDLPPNAALGAAGLRVRILARF